jgi:hypothetical protein
MEEYVIEPLARSAILNAYPLIQLTDPHMSLRAWKTRALAAIGRRGSGEHGILVAKRRARQHICGMVSFQTERDFAQGRVLVASHLIAVDILNARAIMLDLVKALAVQARKQNCKLVRLVVADGAAMADMLPGAVLEAEPRSRMDRFTNLSFAT